MAVIEQSLTYAFCKSIDKHEIIQFCLYGQDKWHYIDIETYHFSNADWLVFEDLDLSVFGEDYFNRNIYWFLEAVDGTIENIVKLTDCNQALKKLKKKESNSK